MHVKNDVTFMPTDPSDPSSPKPSTNLYQMTSDAPKSGGGGGIFFVILLLLLCGGGAAYYFLVYKPAAAAGATIVPPPTAAAGTPKPVASTTPRADTSGNPTYNNAQRTQYIKQADNAFLALRDAKTGPYTAAFNAMLNAGGFSAVGLTSKEAIAARRDLVAKCQAANDDYEAFTKTQDATFKAELQKTPLIPNDVDYVLSDFSYKAQTNDNLKLRALQRDSLKTGDDMLAYLDKSYGNWSVNEKQHLTFKKPGDAAPFSALAKTYSEQVAAISKLQNDIKATADPNSVATTTPAASPAASGAPVSPAVASPAASPVASATP